MHTTTLGELTVSAQGLGCMGMSEFYGHTDWDESVATIHRALDPRFTGEAGATNQAIAGKVRAVAEAKGVAPAQLALAWVYAQAPRLGVTVAPIPGTKRVKWLEQNVAAMDITLTGDELAALEPLAGQAVGGRY
jgi:aryl-alcohol dehydrogenase-like predicted oxidoreductase